MSEALGVHSTELSLPSPTSSKKLILPSLLPLSRPPEPLPDPSPPLLQDDEDDLDFEENTGSVYDCINKKLSLGERHNQPI